LLARVGRQRVPSSALLNEYKSSRTHLVVPPPIVTRRCWRLSIVRASNLPPALLASRWCSELVRARTAVLVLVLQLCHLCCARTKRTRRWMCVDDTPVLRERRKRKVIQSRKQVSGDDCEFGLRWECAPATDGMWTRKKLRAIKARAVECQYVVAGFFFFFFFFVAGTFAGFRFRSRRSG
jgi:hypothetical protein